MSGSHPHAPPAFHVMAKPTGARCNLRCDYCFFLRKLAALAGSARQRAFGRAKQSSLPGYCRACRYLALCNGECPKNRIALTPDGEPGLNWLCPGLMHFFAHTERSMGMMAELLRTGRSAPDVMELLAGEGAR